MRRLRMLGLATAAALATIALATPASADDSTTWTITITNLTPPGPGAPGSQPLSPPLFVVHASRADVWSVGAIASHGVAAIAEDADNRVLESALPQVPAVRTVFTGAGGPIPSGGSRAFTVRTSGRFDRLSVLTMLVNTNDAFTGLDSVRLRGRGATLARMAYDAGSERNNELRGFIPGPCCNHPFVRDPEGELIRPHPGISGAGELDPALYDWQDPVAHFTIQRVT
jgi:Spondin_N